jgi:hypothetical protein
VLASVRHGEMMPVTGDDVDLNQTVVVLWLLNTVPQSEQNISTARETQFCS